MSTICRLIRWLRSCFNRLSRPLDRDEASGGRASAFVLQALPQPGIVVRFRADLSPGKNASCVLRIRGNGQIPLADIHTDDLLMRSGVGQPLRPPG